MGRKLSDIEDKINSSNLKFLSYLKDGIGEDVFKTLMQINEITEVIVFSGVIRNFFIKRNEIRDLDIILKDRIDITKFFDNSSSIQKNRYGGYKIKINNFIIDLWYLNDTWALKYEKRFDFAELYSHIPSTAFFNFSSIIFSFKTNSFNYTKEFLRFLRDKEINVVYKANLDYKLCLVNSFYYSKKYSLKISDNLMDLLRHIHKAENKKYEEIQIKHFGEILFKDEELDNFIIKRISKPKDMN